eukprot:c12025_g2_i1.p1 GENE.c12025_g2_i1~~c12025_g2_i1.p1  ORF type:complete len:211 (-),score=64.91 c12025_g2_i1:186-818(-)
MQQQQQAQSQQEAVIVAPTINPRYKQKHVLHNSWCLWYDNPGKKVSQHNWSDYIKKLNTFHTVEDFWCLHNNVFPPSQLVSGSNYHLFKNGIEPKWEDPKNEKGGKWIFVLPRPQKNLLDEFWLRAALSLIGENYEFGEDICGCVVSIRKTNDKIAIWTSNAANESAVRAIGDAMRTFLEIPAEIRIGYQVHLDAMKRDSSYNNTNLMQL